MARPIQCFLAGLVVLVAVIIVVTMVMTADIGGTTTATYRKLEFSAQVSYFTKKLQQVSNASDNKVTWELTDGLPTLDSDSEAYSSTTQLVNGTAGLEHVGTPQPSHVALRVSDTHTGTVNSTIQLQKLENVTAQIELNHPSVKILRLQRSPNHLPSDSIRSNRSQDWLTRPEHIQLHDQSTTQIVSPKLLQKLYLKSPANTYKATEVDSQHQSSSSIDNPVLPLVKAQTTEERTAEQLKHLTLLTQKHNFTFPCHRVFKPVSAIMKAQWVNEFIEFLSQCQSRQVTLVVANTRYEEILLNWLISATVVLKPPLENIIVVALDMQLYNNLKLRRIASIWVPYSTIFNRKYPFKRFDLVMMTRLGLMRLVNHFGYDCAMYDIDAIVLKNPQQLYSQYKSDIVSSRGTFPRELRKQWHVAMCIGAVFIRSNYRTEQYWEAVTRLRLHVENANDQVRLNYGLYVLGTKWKGRYADEFKSPMYGLSKNHLTTTVLPFKVVCRYNYCRSSKRSLYYIWHKGGNRNEDSKKAGAAGGHTWYLREDWRSHSRDNGTLKGTQWLYIISTLRPH